ncbi:unnamed protein product, partial [Staurois parvus]
MSCQSAPAMNYHRAVEPCGSSLSLPQQAIDHYYTLFVAAEVQW